MRAWLLTERIESSIWRPVKTLLLAVVFKFKLAVVPVSVEAEIRDLRQHSLGGTGPSCAVPFRGASSVEAPTTVFLLLSTFNSHQPPRAMRAESFSIRYVRIDIIGGY